MDGIVAHYRAAAIRLEPHGSTLVGPLLRQAAALAGKARELRGDTCQAAQVVRLAAR